jgi:hypothetical protein
MRGRDGGRPKLGSATALSRHYAAGGTLAWSGNGSK